MGADSNVNGTAVDLPHSPEPRRRRPDAELSETGVAWDEARREWIAEDAVSLRSTVAGSQEGGTVPGVSEQSEKLSDPEKQSSEPIWVEWDSPTDPANPQNFSKSRKWTTTLISIIFTAAVGWASASFAVGNKSMMADLGCTQTEAVAALSMFPLGFGLMPLLTAPWSEVYGRYRMYVASCLLYVVFMIPIGVGKNIATVAAFRFLSGLAASTGSTVVGGTIADLFDTPERGLPMSLFSVCTFAGTGLGPSTLGYVAEKLDWRWIQYIQIIMGFVLLLAIAFLTTETRGSVILSRRAASLRKTTGDLRYQCRTDAERASLKIMMKTSMTRPIYLLFTEPVVASFSLFIGFAWGILYLALEAVTLVMTERYNFSIGQSGLAFFAIVAASILGFVTNLYQERLYTKYVSTRGPEARLYGACVGGVVFPIGLFVFAFTQGRTHWMGPICGLVLTFTGIYAMYLATFNYLADSYTIYASSALSGQSLCRNLAGTIFPFFVFQMYGTLGYTWATFLAGCLGLLLAFVPFVLLAYGPRIRAASKFARELERMRAAK